MMSVYAAGSCDIFWSQPWSQRTTKAPRSGPHWHERHWQLHALGRRWVEQQEIRLGLEPISLMDETHGRVFGAMLCSDFEVLTHRGF